MQTIHRNRSLRLWLTTILTAVLLAVGLALLAGFRFGPGSFRVIALLSAALIPNLLILVLNWIDIQSIGGLGSEGIAFGPMVLFGKTPRGAAAFLGLLLVPLLARSVMPAYTNWLTRYIVGKVADMASHVGIACSGITGNWCCISDD